MLGCCVFSVALCCFTSPLIVITGIGDDLWFFFFKFRSPRRSLWEFHSSFSAYLWSLRCRATLLWLCFHFFPCHCCPTGSFLLTGSSSSNSCSSCCQFANNLNSDWSFFSFFWLVACCLLYWLILLFSVFHCEAVGLHVVCHPVLLFVQSPF